MAVRLITDTAIGDASIFRLLGVPECLHELMEFAGVRFRHKAKSGLALLLSDDAYKKIGDWIMCMPCSIHGKQVEIPLPDQISSTDPEGHWRAILAAAADFQYLINSGQYTPA